MTIRHFLATGLLVGLVAGVLTFAVAHVFGESPKTWATAKVLSLIHI